MLYLMVSLPCLIYRHSERFLKVLQDLRPALEVHEGMCPTAPFSLTTLAQMLCEACDQASEEVITRR